MELNPTDWVPVLRQLWESQGTEPVRVRGFVQAGGGRITHEYCRAKHREEECVSRRLNRLVGSQIGPYLVIEDSTIRDSRHAWYRILPAQEHAPSLESFDGLGPGSNETTLEGFTDV